MYTQKEIETLVWADETDNKTYCFVLNENNKQTHKKEICYMCGGQLSFFQHMNCSVCGKCGERFDPEYKF